VSITTLPIDGVGVDLPAGTDGLDYGNDGFAHLNKDISVLFRGAPKADLNTHIALQIAGANTEAYHAQVDGNNNFTFTLSGVADIASSISAVANRLYSAGFSYKRGSNVRFSIFDCVASTLAWQTVSNTSTPAAANNNSYIGLHLSAGAGWARLLSSVLIWSRALSDTELQWLHVEPWAVLLPQSPRVRYFIPPAVTAAGWGPLLSLQNNRLVVSA
jgi:hypothetical protein